MADDLLVTPGTGATIRMVEKSSKKAQVVVLDLGGAGAESLLTTTLPVSLATNTPTLAAGENHAGAIGGHTACIDVVPVLTTHATYVANDYVGTDGDAMTFANCARVNAGTGIIIGAVLVDYAKQSVAGELWLFDTEPTPPADSAAWSISDAHAARCIGVIPFNTYFASALNSVSPVGNQTIAFQCAGGSRDLYGCFVTRGAPTYASGDLTFRLHVVQD